MLECSVGINDCWCCPVSSVSVYLYKLVSSGPHIGWLKVRTILNWFVAMSLILAFSVHSSAHFSYNSQLRDICLLTFVYTTVTCIACNSVHLDKELLFLFGSWLIDIHSTSKLNCCCSTNPHLSLWKLSFRKFSPYNVCELFFLTTMDID